LLQLLFELREWFFRLVHGHTPSLSLPLCVAKA
jgi:hypothetical protein